jgi:flagellar M-ring protein FliF
MSAAAGRLGTTVRGFSAGQKTVAIIGVAVLALGVAALATWASKPALSPLFSGLSATDASSIVEQLKTDGVTYELTNGGGTILVPEASVYEERLKAASAGLPTSSTGGYSLLDSMGVTTSEFQQSVTYKRAIEGELAATVGAMKGVRTASVKIATPKDTVFASTKIDPTASVFIEADNGVTLSSDQVEAIVHLTSASIEGMKPEDVAVIDSNGSVLSTVAGQTAGAADKLTTAYEESARVAVQTMLDRIVGSGNATVAVSADISSESATRTSETFTSPSGELTLSDSNTTETYTGTGGGAAGVLGPDNIAVPGGAENGNYDNETLVRNNAIDKVTENRTIPGGAVARQTISVALNDTVAGNLNIDDIQALVESAAGFDAARGDVVTVASIGFDAASADEAKAALQAEKDAAAADRTNELIRTGVIAGGIAVPLIIGMILFLRRSRQNRERLDIDDVDDVDLPAIHIHEPKPSYVAPPPVTTSVPAHEPTPVDRKKAEISNLAGQDPHKTAGYLRGFLEERQNS